MKHEFYHHGQKITVQLVHKEPFTGKPLPGAKPWYSVHYNDVVPGLPAHVPTHIRKLIAARKLYGKEYGGTPYVYFTSDDFKETIKNSGVY